MPRIKLAEHMEARAAASGGFMLGYRFMPGVSRSVSDAMAARLLRSGCFVIEPESGEASKAEPDISRVRPRADEPVGRPLPGKKKKRKQSSSWSNGVLRTYPGAKPVVK